MEKKQLLLRISQKLYEDIVRMANDEFRSVNAEIEYILTNSVRNSKKKQELVIDKLFENISKDKTAKAIDNFLKIKEEQNQ